MASLEVVRFGGIVSLAGSIVEIIDGGPVESVTTVSGSTATLPGTIASPALVKLNPIGGNAVLTWPNGVAETITGPEFRRTRGEQVGVA